MNMRIETMGHGDSMVLDLALGKKILNILEKYYAEHAWFVDVSHEAGTATVQLMYEGKDRKVRVWKYGFLHHITKLDSEEIEKKIMKSGGEVLERYHMARGRAKSNDIMDFMEKGIDASGMAV